MKYRNTMFTTATLVMLAWLIILPKWQVALDFWGWEIISVVVLALCGIAVTIIYSAWDDDTKRKRENHDQ